MLAIPMEDAMLEKSHWAPVIVGEIGKQLWPASWAPSCLADEESGDMGAFDSMVKKLADRIISLVDQQLKSDLWTAAIDGTGHCA